MKKQLENIVAAGLCHGCGACVAAVGSDKLGMAFDNDGYLRPKATIPLTRADSIVAAAVCSGVALSHEPNDKRPVATLWGPLLSVQTGFATDPDIRFVGSSGGVISALALHLLETGQTDVVVQIAADPLDPIGNAVKISRDREDIRSAAGSRYAPSSPLSGLSDVLATQKRFVFIGKPCDVAALRRLAKFKVEVDRYLVMAISFMCAGVPSRNGTHELLAALGTREKEVATFAFRGEGWPGFVRARLHDGRELKMDYKNSWGRILNKHLQFRCKICPDGTGEFADVVCADAWYGANGFPDFTERDGRSLVLARTEAGRRTVEAAGLARRVEYSPLDVGEIAKMQPYQVTRKRNLAMRLLGVRLAGGAVPHFRRLGLLKAAVSERPKALARNFVGSFLRSRRR